jgi:hypothetical protein
VRVERGEMKPPHRSGGRGVGVGVRGRLEEGFSLLTLKSEMRAWMRGQLVLPLLLVLEVVINPITTTD